ncbi:hypothetical protein Tco_1452144 [Tanacetum coccineum]
MSLIFPESRMECMYLPYLSHHEEFVDMAYGSRGANKSLLYCKFLSTLGNYECPNLKAKIMSPRMRTRSIGRPAAESLGGGTGERVGRGGKGRRPREGNDEHIDELNGQGNDQGLGANGGVEGDNRNVSNQGNVGNQNGNEVNKNV